MASSSRRCGRWARALSARCSSPSRRTPAHRLPSRSASRPLQRRITCSRMSSLSVRFWPRSSRASASSFTMHTRMTSPSSWFSPSCPAVTFPSFSTSAMRALTAAKRANSTRCLMAASSFTARPWRLACRRSTTVATCTAISSRRTCCSTPKASCASLTWDLPLTFPRARSSSAQAPAATGRLRRSRRKRTRRSRTGGRSA
mmetsp:Transcript_29590/g.76430  ORF Transcript_29590/g.76430 Transcript_29590/m.76430 type:complete len:201 (+) Transcript_29590:368-970(+)